MGELHYGFLWSGSIFGGSLNVTITEKEKVHESNIRSAFLKGNTKEHLLLYYADQPIAGISAAEPGKAG